MNNILIIGASGYIGAKLSYLLAMDGYNITALCFPSFPENKKWTSVMKEVIVADITSEEVVGEITSQSFDVAVHLVSLDHFSSNKEPAFVNSVNVMPVWNLLEAFKLKKTLKLFIYFSTIHVYGKLTIGIIDESFPPSPRTPYGLTHLMAENICNLYNTSSSIACVNVRVTNSYGSPFFKENNCWWLVINDFCKKAFYDKKIIILSDGSPQRDFIHSLDVYRAIEILINNHKKNMKNNIYHISSGKTLTILDLAYTVKKVYKKQFNEDVQIIYHNKVKSEEKYKTRQADKYIVDNSNLVSLGFQVKTNLIDGISEVFNYLKEDNE